MQRYVWEQAGDWEGNFPFILMYTEEKTVFSDDLPEVCLKIILHCSQDTAIILPFFFPIHL